MPNKKIKHVDVLVWLKLEDAKFEIKSLPRSFNSSIEKDLLCIVACKAGSHTLSDLVDRSIAALQKIPPRFRKSNKPTISIGVLMSADAYSQSFRFSTKDLQNLRECDAELSVAIYISSD